MLDERAERVVIDSPQSAAGLATERSMVEDGVSPVSVVNYKEQETHQTFIRGAPVFARNWPYMNGLISDPKQSNVDPEQVDVAPLPHAEGRGASAASAAGTCSSTPLRRRRAPPGPS